MCPTHAGLCFAIPVNGIPPHQVISAWQQVLFWMRDSHWHRHSRRHCRRSSRFMRNTCEARRQLFLSSCSPNIMCTCPGECTVIAAAARCQVPGQPVKLLQYRLCPTPSLSLYGRRTSERHPAGIHPRGRRVSQHEIAMQWLLSLHEKS